MDKKEIKEKSKETNISVSVLSVIEWTLFFAFALFVPAVVFAFWKELNTIGLVGWGFAFLWFLICRGYKGAINAYKDHNKDLTESLIDVLGFNKNH